MNPLLTTTVEDRDRLRIIRVDGEVDMSSAPLLEKALNEATSTHPLPDTLAIDLTGVSFFASAGLTVLLLAHHTCTESQTPLTVVAPPNSAARRTITMTSLDQIFTLAERP